MGSQSIQYPDFLYNPMPTLTRGLVPLWVCGCFSVLQLSTVGYCFLLCCLRTCSCWRANGFTMLHNALRYYVRKYKRGERVRFCSFCFGGGGLPPRELPVVMKNRIPPTADIMYVLRTDLSLLEARLLSNTPVVPSLLDMEKHRETRETSLQKAKGQRGADLSL
jgi:hypothetical protein